MTKWGRLLATLDKVSRCGDRKESSVKKGSQGYDEKTSGHVFIIQHRVMRGEHSDPRRRKQAIVERRVNQKEVGNPLRDIHTRMQFADLAAVGTWDIDSPDYNPPT